jgi:hypothetical protein
LEFQTDVGMEIQVISIFHFGLHGISLELSDGLMTENFHVDLGEV